jgi:YbbR domain-containing protein
MRRFIGLHPGVLALALTIAVFLWGIAHGSSSIEQSFDIPIELHKLEDSLVVTDQSVDQVNVRIRGSRASLRNVSPERLKYAIDVSGGKPGVAVYDIDVDRIELPGGARFVSNSPSRLQVRYEKTGRKAVAVRADLEGEPAAGYHLTGVTIEPPKVWLSGARSQVMRMDEIVTETINITGINADDEHEVRLFLGGGTVWMEENQSVKVVVHVEAELVPDIELEILAELEEGA